MKTVSIFIAGSTVLQSQRTSLKALAIDLNNEFEHKNGVHLQVYSYESFRDNQKAYDEFITSKADLVMFIIDGKVGTKTHAEFELAAQTFTATGSPRILVFIHKLDQLTPEIAHFEGYVEAATGNYCITYTDDTDLVKQAEIRMRRLITSSEPEAENTAGPCVYAVTAGSENSLKSELCPAASAKQPKKRRKYLWLIALASVAAIALLAYIFIPASSTSDNGFLIIAGGGSAANHIKKMSDVTLTEYPSACYLHMPSEVAWQLLTEEVISNNGSQHYVPVCVSASMATDQSFLSDIVTASKFTEIASVISFDMGSDTLVAYVAPTGYTSRILAPEINSKSITVSRLAELIGNDSLSVLPTSPRSGTRNTYRKLLEAYGADFSNTESTFSEISDGDHLTRSGKPYVVLGTASYYPHIFDNPTFPDKPVALTVVDSAGRAAGKPVKLYCLAYVENGKNEMKFPPITKKLLRDLHQDTIPVIDSILHDPTFMRTTQAKVVLTPRDLYRKQ